MKQRTLVQSIVKKNEKILLLRRPSSQGGKAGIYDLPGGRVDDGEQPEEAAARYIKELTGLNIKNLFLSDVFTYVDQEGRDTHNTVVVYTSVVTESKVNIQLASAYSRYAWEKPADINRDEVSGLARLLLDMLNSRSNTPVDVGDSYSDVNYSTKKQEGLIVYSDGGSRGNPGPSAAGYVVFSADNIPIYEGGSYLGITTNNQAEYHGVRLGLEKARELGARSVTFYIDSLLVVNQLNGVYVIKNRELWPIHERIKELISQFDKVTFSHVKREFNQKADGMVNKILDARVEKKV